MLLPLLTCALIGFVAPPSQAAGQPPPDRFVVIGDVRLHYLDWGGSGSPLLFLTSFGASAHEFDRLAPHFTGRFHVLGLTRRGQPPSAEPLGGYDTRTLVEDIRGFLDAQGIARAALIGYSVAGVEETLFASLYPERVSRLVYLDAIGDAKSAYELATTPATRYPLPLEEPPSGALGAIAKGARAADPDYTNVKAAALAFCVIYDRPFIPPEADAALRARLVARYERYGRPFEEQQRAHFRRDMKNGRIVELHDTDHAAFIQDPVPQSIVVREMLAFLSAPAPPGR
jgi:pimeloyl-ACP methyl ester carboxylesterase